MARVKVETVRFIADRYEWAATARHARSVYHRWEWTEQSRRRVAFLFPRVKVASAYLRVWLGDTLVGCPVLSIDGIWFNTPRSTPLVIDGPGCDVHTAIAEAIEYTKDDVVIVDDTEQLRQLEAIRWELTIDSTDCRSRRSITPSDLTGMARALTFDTDTTGELWFDGIRWVSQSGWDIRLDEYRRNDEPIGWTITTPDPSEGVTVLAAAHVEQIVPPWTSLR